MNGRCLTHAGSSRRREPRTVQTQQPWQGRSCLLGLWGQLSSTRPTTHRERSKRGYRGQQDCSAGLCPRQRPEVREGPSSCKWLSLAVDNFLVPSTAKSQSHSSLLTVYTQNDVVPMRVRKLSCFPPSYNWLLCRTMSLNLLNSKSS